MAASQPQSSNPPPGALDPPAELIVAPLASLSLEPCHQGLTAEAALDGGPLIPTCRVQVPASGDHWLAVASRDGAGLLSPVRFVRVRVDADPPEVILSIEPSPVPGPDGRRFVPPGSHVRALARDALAGVARLFVAAPEEQESASPDEHLAELPEQGDVAVRAWALDRLGNRSGERREGVSIDREAPRGEIRLVGPRSGDGDRLFVGPGTAATPEVTDPDSGVERWVGILDGSEAPEALWAGPWPSGRHRLEAWAQDRVGNRGSFTAVELLVDSKPPEIQWAIEDASFACGAARAYSPPVTVAVQAADHEAGVETLEWSAGGADWQSATATLQVSGDSLRLRARDRVGNESVTEARWITDRDAPALSLRAPDGRPLPPGTPLSVALDHEVALEAEDRCGVATLRLAIGAGPWDRAPDRVRFESIGTYRLLLEAVDAGGNRSNGEWLVSVGRGDR